MKFVDQAIIKVISGKGGNGCISFRREAFVPRGGPDGGDGGKGADVVIRADESLNTLLDCQYQQFYRGRKGEDGKGKNQTGKSAENLNIQVPPGTQVFDVDTGELIADLDEPNSFAVVAKGGRGGQGNVRFATARNQAPRRAQPGEPAQERELRLELKLIADVGLVGLPNSGKSTLISRVSNARPKIADYPFTTKVPGLGVVRAPDGRDFVMADIPGLIEGAHEGAGMGDRFLRHIERTRILLHLIDPSPTLEPPAVERFRTIMLELSSYGADLTLRTMFVVITKMDIPENRTAADELGKFVEEQGLRVKKISAVSGEGLRDLLFEVSKALKDLRSRK
ncbi:MAG: GTPase ObgE [Deltaproteobacteria bacterium]|nr:GTPase ObgE [Deltaproteobacteria bacterium]